MMSKTIQNAVKRVQKEVRIAKAYAKPIKNIDLEKNDLAVKKFLESFKK